MVDRKLFSPVVVALVLLGSIPGYTQSTPTQSGNDRGVQTNDRGAQTSPSAPQSGGAARENARAGDSNLISTAIEMNVAEIEAGKLAAGKAQNAKVKDFANMMVKDHTQALTKLRGLQTGSTTDVKPNAKHQQTADRLSKLSAAEFDREFMNVMVSDHQEAVNFLEQHSTGSGSRTSNSTPTSGSRSGDSSAAGASDRSAPNQRGASAGSNSTTDLASVAQDLLPTVRQHLQLAQQLQKDLQGNGQRPNNTSASPNSSGQRQNNTTTSPNSNSQRPNNSTGSPNSDSKGNSDPAKSNPNQK